LSTARLTISAGTTARPDRGPAWFADVAGAASAAIRALDCGRSAVGHVSRITRRRPSIPSLPFPSRELLQLSSGLQGRTFGAPGRPTTAETREDARGEHGERERAGPVPRCSGQGGGGSRRRWRGSLARFLLRDSASSRAAARRADAPPPRRSTHPAVTRRGSRAPRVGRAGRHAPGTPIAGRKVTAHRAGTPRIVRVGPSSVKGTRRSFLTASQKRSSGPTLERRRPNADPAGLTARARPEARPETRAANLREEARHVSEGRRRTGR
jgi:hypothetical protein